MMDSASRRERKGEEERGRGCEVISIAGIEAQLNHVRRSVCLYAPPQLVIRQPLD